MKEKMILHGWWIRRASEQEVGNAFKMEENEMIGEQNGWVYSGIADQVQKVLLDHGMIDARVGIGETEQCSWIEECDWLYACDFVCDLPWQADKAFLNFLGVDLFADFHLNGHYIGSHDDQFIPKRIEISKFLEKQNRLVAYFHSPRKMMEKLYKEMPESWHGIVAPPSLLRKGHIDFGDAGKVSMLNVGLFEDVVLELVDHVEIDWPDINVDFDHWYRFADVSCIVNCTGIKDNLSIRMSITDPDGTLLSAERADAFPNSEKWQQAITIRVENPKLWWPKNYGDHPLYRLDIELLSGDEVLDCVSRKIGMRKIEKTGDMRFRVNDKEIKQWGALLEPFSGLTHRWNPSKCHEMLELTDHCNMNTLRIWGGGMQYGEELYDECDRLGILIWQEFFIDWTYMPDSEEYRIKYRAEAEYEVKRVKHRACVLLYSGGNESLVGLLEGTYRKIDVGWKIFTEDFAKPCHELDPNRFYLTSSPCGGDYPSDPREGDGHPLYYTYRHAIVQYPLFLSEQARSTTGPLHSLRRFMSDEELWPKDYVNQVTHSQFNPTYNVRYPDKPYYQYDPEYQSKYSVGWSVPQLSEDKPFGVTSWKRVPVPETWWRRAAAFFASECAPLERFFDAENIHELIYRINAATAWFFKDDAERIRRGKPHYEVGEPRRCQGYIYVKLNATWPQFYCTLIDFFQEVYIPYYQYRRSLSPVLLSFDFQDRIFLWGVNDTLQAVQGTLEVRVFSIIRNKIVNEFSCPVFIEPGESKVLTPLDRVCPLTTESVVQAKLFAGDGSLIASSDTLVDIERHQSFPDARITLEAYDDVIIVSTDQYAHCVEMTGNEEGDEFNWYFEDNFFNLLPYEEKRLKIMGKHKKGTIHAKAHYSQWITNLEI
jgi:hypothetical protein